MLKKIFIISIIIFCAINIFADKWHDLADKSFNKAEKFKKQYKYKEAARMYEKSAEAEEKSDNPRKNYLSVELTQLGYMYYKLGKHKEALDYYKKALKINKNLNYKDGIAVQINYIGDVYNFQGQYDKAVEYYRKALAINEELGKKGRIAVQLHNIGMVYYSWGHNDKAIEYYRKALVINEELDKKDLEADLLSDMGLVYNSQEQFDKALDHYRRALTINRKLGKKDKVAINFFNIGELYNFLGERDRAIDYYMKALIIDEELGNKNSLAIHLNGLADAYYYWAQYDKAIEYLKKALVVAEELGQKNRIALILRNFGRSYWWKKKYKKAIDYFKRSIALTENLRITAEGSVRRYYLASQIYTYQLLISTYIRDKKVDAAFDTIELCSAKYLLEQIGAKLNKKDFKFKGIKKYKKQINKNSAVINYANINTYMGVAQIVADKNNVKAVEVDQQNFIEKIHTKYKQIISSSIRGLRILNTVRRKSAEPETWKDSDFFDIIMYYRLLLSKQQLTQKERTAMRYISKELYKFLFGNIKKYLKGKDQLLIIPDSVLAFLPFETLIMPDGRYLVEKYHIKYTQSLAVLGIVADRKYDPQRKPLIAFGGAVYDEVSYKTDMICSEKQLEYLKDNTLLALKRSKSTRFAYNRLGLGEWKNLPGSLAEVHAIKNIIKNSDIYTGESVDESKIKDLSKKNELKQYKVLHFATHSLVVPEIPELSAIVLSLFNNEKNNEDGYLTMKEIVKLNINADFVNLSACETGLGKIYKGEGVVGLIQSFLIAGANALSVSLWQVEDESTMKFMIGVYNLVKEKGISYARAITEMKRAFICGAVDTGKYSIARGLQIKKIDLNNKKPGKYSNPFFWAPFVYYGK